MIYLILTILCGAVISIALRFAEGKVSSKTGMLSMNYLTCFLGVGAVMGYGTILPGITAGGDGIVTLGLGAWTGFLYMAALMLLQYNVEKSGVILASVFQKLGLILFFKINRLNFHLFCKLNFSKLLIINKNKV